MKNLTRNGIAKDITKSPYIFTEMIDGNIVNFYFSSKLHLNSFTEKRDANFNMIYNYIYKRFKFKVNCRLLSDCNLYMKIESRGFYIKINNKGYVCPSNITLSGGLRTKKSLDEWRETLMISYAGL